MDRINKIQYKWMDSKFVNNTIWRGLVVCTDQYSKSGAQLTSMKVIVKYFWTYEPTILYSPRIRLSHANLRNGGMRNMFCVMPCSFPTLLSFLYTSSHCFSWFLACCCNWWHHRHLKRLLFKGTLSQPLVPEQCFCFPPSSLQQLLFLPVFTWTDFQCSISALTRGFAGLCPPWLRLSSPVCMG